ncbi:MAG: hypothetical protein GEU99_22150 [Luteitalea sp.]|nr:hypothetical protein [Luteitalea sp.]
MDVVSPAILDARIRQSERDERFIALTSEGDLKEAHVLAVMRPSPIHDEADRTRVRDLQSTLVTSGQWMGANVVQDTGTIIAAFRAGKGPVTSVGGYRIDGERMSVSLGADGTLRQFFLRGNALANAQGDALFSSPQPLSISAFFSNAGVDVETNAATASRVRVYCPKKAPAQVTLNDRTVADVIYDAGSRVLQIDIPSGYAMLRVR